MLLKKVLTSSNVDGYDFPREINDGLSLTVPDQALTPQQLLRRFASGQPLSVNTIGVYDDDYDGIQLPEFSKMSKIDRLHAIQENSFNVQELYTEFSDIRKKAEAKRLRDKRNVVEAQNDDLKRTANKDSENNK